LTSGGACGGNCRVADETPPDPSKPSPKASPNPKSSPDQGAWADIIKAVSAPIGFFALALLVIEAPFPVVFGLSHHTNGQFKWTMIIMTGLIVLVVSIVGYLTLKDPHDLITGWKSAVAKGLERLAPPR
jgi:hypothetical protein